MKVIFCRSKKPFSLLIRMVTWSKWSHCGVVCGKNVIHSTARKGVHKIPLEEIKKQYSDYEIAEMDGDPNIAISLIGRKYDWSGLFGHWFGAWNDKDRWFCSELVAYCNHKIRRGTTSRITPQHCYMFSTR